MSVRLAALAILTVGLLAAANGAAERAATAPFPGGDEGALIRYGHDIFTNTQRLMPANVRAGMPCEACHLDAGRRPRGGSLLGIYALFPQWNARSHRFIALQDRLAECFLYSMNGRPPAYDSREMIALTAYIAFLSRGAEVGAGFPHQRSEIAVASRPPNVAAGRVVYARRCVACHAADGGGASGAYPPLWGTKSFNSGAGMDRVTTMAAFVRENMPFGSAPETLSVEEAYDVAAYVLSHPRPRFDGRALVAFPAQPAKHF